MVNSLTNLQARIITAAVAGPVVIVAAWLHPLTFLALVAATVVVMAREWSRMVMADRDDPGLFVGLCAVVGVGLAVGFASGPVWGLTALLVGGIAVALAAAALGMGWGRPLLFGAIYLGVAAQAVIWLRTQPGIGDTLVIWLLVVVWATDIGAYAVGRSIGGPRLWPSLSPRKTWAGFGGGLLCAAAAGLVLQAAIVGGIWSAVAVLAVVVSLATQAGDLLESRLKRRYGLKDTGRLLPGHGGVLDRLDGLLIAAPLFALVHAVFGDELTWQ